MTKTKTIPFAELRRFLHGLGYRAKDVDNAHIFHLKKDRLLIFRRYGDREPVGQGDIISTRKFLDAWGVLDAADFDAFLDSAAKPA